ncbi:MAG TPA: fumarate hydratase [Leeuwenhoekiella sp.]|nr:fumarate hydratase [Leeuwenhoekiella sp.]
MKKFAVISGDIVAFTSLADLAKKKLETATKELFEVLEGKFGTYSRLIKGDYLECAVPNASDGLRVALLFKTFIKSQELEAKNKRHKYFEEYGVRLVLGYGSLSRFEPENGIIDGEAIYMSGRQMNEESTHYKERVIIKNTLKFVSTVEALNQPMEPLFALLDFLTIRATRKQCEVAHYKLMNLSEEEIAGKLGTSQSAVNQHSTRIGWNAIEKAVTYYEQLLSQ